MSTATPLPSDDVFAYEVVAAVRRLWWVPLILGILWVVVSLIIFRFNTHSVAAVGILVGIVFVFAALEELVTASAVQGGWRWFHAILGVAFLVGAVVSFVHPGNTFFALAEIVGWLLLIKGVFDIVLGLANRDLELWWTRLALGIIELALAMLVAGSLDKKALFVLIFVGATAMLRGIALIITAFQLRGTDA